MFGWTKNIAPALEAGHKYLGTMVIMFFMIVTLMSVFTIMTHFDQLMRLAGPSPQEEADRFPRTLHIGTVINAELGYARQQINADRLLVSEYHNNTHDLTGLPFTSIQTIAIQTKGSAYNFDNPHTGESRSLFEYTDLLNLMWKPNQNPQCARLDTQAIPEGDWKDRLVSHGVQVTFNCPMYNPHHYPIGHITASYVWGDKQEDRPTDAIILAKLRDTAGKIQDKLISIETPKHCFLFCKKD